MKELIELLSRLDNWANKKQLSWPKFLRVNPQDLNLAGRLILRLFKFVLVLAVIAGIIWFVYFFTYHGPGSVLNDQDQQHTLPTLEPTATTIPNTNPWREEQWLDQDEAAGLRSQTNVINLAYISGGGAKYSRSHTVVLTNDGSWQEVKPLGMTELTVNATSIAFKLNAQEYTLNVYQPFVDAENPNYIYIVDLDGRMWRTNTSSVTAVSLEDGIKTLPVVINPNPDLSFTY